MRRETVRPVLLPHNYAQRWMRFFTVSFSYCYSSVTSAQSIGRGPAFATKTDVLRGALVHRTPSNDAATTRRAGASHREVTVQDILDAIMAAEGAKDPARELAGIGGLAVPDSYQGVVVRADEQNMFDGLASRDRDPRKSLHVQEVPTPELAPGEALYLPAGREVQRTRVLDELRAFNRLPVWQALLIGAIGFAGMFSVFSYLAPTMVEVTGVAPAWIPAGLAGFGLGGLIGNIIGGWLFDRLRLRAVPVVLGWAVLMLLLFPLAANWPWSLLLATVCIGMMGALGPILQSHLMDVADGAQTLAAASHHAAFNAANALGPLLGGMAISAGFGWTSTGPVGALTAVAGIGLYAWTARTRARRLRACAAT